MQKDAPANIQDLISSSLFHRTLPNGNVLFVSNNYDPTTPGEKDGGNGTGEDQTEESGDGDDDDTEIFLPGTPTPTQHA